MFPVPVRLLTAPQRKDQEWKQQKKSVFIQMLGMMVELWRVL